MGTANPFRWARDRRHRLARWARGDVGLWTRRARDICLPGVPVCAILGFFANGNLDENTTGWIAGDAMERAEALVKLRYPLKNKNPHEGYGAIGSDDLDELGPGGVEAGRRPKPVATDPECPWVQLAKSPEVVKALGREGVTGRDWYGAHEDQVVIGVANLARHLRAIHAKLDARLQWDATKPVTLWPYFCAVTRWSAGGGGTARHLDRFEVELAAVVGGARVGTFLRLAAAVDDPGTKHQQDEYSGLRWAQKREAMVLAAEYTGEGDAALEWLDDGLDDGPSNERKTVYDRLVEIAS